jgi:hypothetical protein
VTDWPAWDEREYLDHLETERTHFAWAMQHHGGLSADEARQAAVEFYEYEAPDAPFRGLVFHDLAWKWAMERIMAGCDHPCWRTHPVPEPPPDYPGYIAPGSTPLPTQADQDALRRELGGA